MDIMRTYNRTKFDSRGGFKWKLEKQLVWLNIRILVI
jgi:hypothetical protein